MRIKEVNVRKIRDSRKEETVSVEIETGKGKFSTSAPSGKSKGKYETLAYIESIEKSAEILNLGIEKLRLIRFGEFSDLEKLEAVLNKRMIGANIMYALEASILKALAAGEEKELWEFLNEKARKFPFPVGNVIGGGLHNVAIKGKKPDFQEFLILPRLKKIFDNVYIMNLAHKSAGERLKLRKVLGKLNDENAWSTSADNESCLEILNETRDELVEQAGEKIEIGLDIAASSFHTGFLYNYQNPIKRRKNKEQIEYISELAEKFMLSYIEDPLEENAFSDFSVLREKIIRRRPCLITGDDLTASQIDRLKMAIRKRSIGAVIVKPNQNGSLVEIKKIIDLAKKYEVACVMSHRSGETLDMTIADLAFGWQCEFIKTGVIGEERQAKLDRLVEIEKAVG